MPPLRERKEDLPLLVDHFVTLFNRKSNGTIRPVPPETLERLRRYDWPGNVRELESAVKHALIRASSDLITPDCLPESVRNPGNRDGESQGEEAGGGGRLDVVRRVGELLQAGDNDIYRHIHTELDRILLEEVLAQVDGNQVLASQRLGISRTTLRSKLALAEESEDSDSPS